MLYFIYYIYVEYQIYKITTDDVFAYKYDSKRFK